VEIIEPDRDAFRRAAEPMLESYRGTPTYGLIQAIRGVG